MTCCRPAGIERIEVTSFVSPKWVPQLADAAEVMAGIGRRPGVRYAVLTPNMKGFDAALAAEADEVAIFASASEGVFAAEYQLFHRRRASSGFRPVAEAARQHGIPMRGYVSCVVECPYEGAIAPAERRRGRRAVHGAWLLRDQSRRYDRPGDAGGGRS